MASRVPIALDYEVGTVFYPRLRDAPRWLLILIAMQIVPIAVGWWLVTRGGLPALWWLGVLCLSASALPLFGWTLLYIPGATWLCVTRTGITVSVAFLRRFAAWDRIRDVRLVLMDGAITAEPVIEVAFKEPSTRLRRWRRNGLLGYWFINASLFGWSTDALIGEMKRLRPGRQSVNCSNGRSSPTMGS